MGTDNLRYLDGEQIKALRLACTPEGELFNRITDDSFIPVGSVAPELSRLLPLAGAMYSTLVATNMLLEALLETADLIGETAIALQLEQITSSIDLLTKTADGRVDLAR